MLIDVISVKKKKKTLFSTYNISFFFNLIACPELIGLVQNIYQVTLLRQGVGVGN